MTVLCIGKFDALHRGHLALVEAAARVGQPVVLLRFSGMAEALGWAARDPLVAECDRPRILARWTAALALAPDLTEVELPFTTVRYLEAADFLVLIKARFTVTTVVVGEGFRGGRGRSAGADVFRAAGHDLGIEVLTVPAVGDGEGVFSSTRIRTLLAAGDVARAAILLGRRHRVLGTVVRGDGRGRSIGVPTANLGHRLNQIPGAGVYAAWADVAGQRLAAAVNIGQVPTAGAGRAQTVEAHLIGWSGDCYGQRLDLEFCERIRDEQRFPDFPSLVAQIRCDIAEAARLTSVTASLGA